MPRNSGDGHWHITRDIKPRGECRGCDRHRDEVEKGTYDGDSPRSETDRH